MTHTYSRVAIFFHWVIALLIIGQLAGGKYMDSLSFSPQKYELYQLHKSFGILILLLSVLRLLWRLGHRPPPLPGGMKPFERFAAKFTHVAFYVLMIGIPVTGWLLVSSSPTQIATKLFKTVPWPDVPGLTRSKDLADQFSQLHEWMAHAAILLIVLHVGAALKHHFVNKDDVLRRMLPVLRSK